MTLNESIVDNAALEWLGELGYTVGHRPHLAHDEPAAERDSFGELALVGLFARGNPAAEPGHSRGVWDLKLTKSAIL